MNAGDRMRHVGGRQCTNEGCTREASHNLNHRDGGWSPFWCPECDEERVARIDKGFAEIGDQFKKAGEMGRKKNNVAESAPNIEDPKVQAEDHLKKIRTARRLVKKKELEFGNLTEARKIAKEELDAAVADLCRIIDGSSQAELFVGTTVEHVNRATGEIEEDEDEDQAPKRGRSRA